VAQGASASDGLRISQCVIEFWKIPILAGRGFERLATPPGRSRAFALQAAALRRVGPYPISAPYHVLLRIVSQQELLPARWRLRRTRPQISVPAPQTRWAVPSPFFIVGAVPLAFYLHALNY